MGETGKPSPEEMGELDPFKEMRESEYWNKIPPGIKGVTIGEMLEQQAQYVELGPEDTPEKLYKHLEELERIRPRKV